jgi:hypothetical protein
MFLLVPATPNTLDQTRCSDTLIKQWTDHLYLLQVGIARLAGQVHNNVENR